jgi:hypothetical protein
MAWREYPYTGHQWSNSYGMMSRPLIQITLHNGDNFFSPSCLIDSGSEATLVSYEIANELKINLGPCQEIPVGGVGSTKGKLCDVTLEIPDFKIRKDITAVFVMDLPFSVLLGQRDFFTELDIRFEKSKNRFYLKKA